MDGNLVKSCLTLPSVYIIRRQYVAVVGNCALCELKKKCVFALTTAR